MSQPIDLFKHCPKCGTTLPVPAAPNYIQCAQCDFSYYFNPTVAAASILFGPDGRAVFLRRAKDPARDKLSLPGGFVDFGETVEEAVRRETREEVGLDLVELEFLCSRPNAYHYRGITYPVVDLFFVARATSNQAQALDGAASVCWLFPGEVPIEELAFPSVREAFRIYLKRHPPTRACARSRG